jgi:hypothetical protein
MLALETITDLGLVLLGVVAFKMLIEKIGGFIYDCKKERKKNG